MPAKFEIKTRETTNPDTEVNIKGSEQKIICILKQKQIKNETDVILKLLETRF